MLTVEEVRRADQRRRFLEIGRVLFADEPRWAPSLRAYEQWLFDRRHPWTVAGGEVTRLLVRRSGTVVGRVCAHIAPGGSDGAFGAFECADDAGAVGTLLDACRAWLVERGATRIVGPMTFTASDDAGVLVDGYEHAGGTGRPWHPPWYAEHLAACGLAPVGPALPRWRLPAAPGPALPTGGPIPPHAGRFADRRLVLESPEHGAVAAAPDVSAAVRSGAASSFRTQPTEAAIVRCDGDPSVLVPALLAAAAAAGYAALWAPWSAEQRPPDTSHVLLGQNLR